MILYKESEDFEITYDPETDTIDIFDGRIPWEENSYTYINRNVFELVYAELTKKAPIKAPQKIL